MNPEKHDLIETLLDESATARREAILQEGSRIFRRRRWQRAAWRGLAGITAIALAAVFISTIKPRQPKVLTAVVLPHDQTGAVTDAELLAMFPNTPVGLVTLEDGKKRLIFPRPGDANRFMARY